MRRKTLVIFVLAIMMCFCFSFITLAATMSPKDLTLKSIDNLNLGYNKNFYNKSSGTVSFQVDRFKGSSLDGIKILPGTSLNCAYQLDIPGKKSAFDVKLGYNNKIYQGQVYLTQDKLILTKSFLETLDELIPDNELGDLSQYPEYLYVNDAEITDLWMGLLNYSSAQKNTTEETKALLRFFVEAIPADYFKLEGATVILELDQTSFEEIIYLILEKVKNEKVRFADILVNLAANYNDNPQQIKSEIIEGINDAVNNGTWPTKEQIRAMGAFIQVKQFKYQYSIIPGGQRKFDVSLGLGLQPVTGFTGQLDIKSVSTGQVDNCTGIDSVALNFNVPDGISFNGKYSDDFTSKDDTISGNRIISGAAKEKDGSVDFDFELTGNFNAQADNTLSFAVPTLTAQNSMDMSLINGGTNKTAVVPEGQTAIIVNNTPVDTDVKPFIQNGRLMVPIRFVGEALNGEVSWIEPNVIHITRGDKVISMFVGKTSYTIDGRSAKMDTVLVLKDGRVFVPVRFVAEALNCNVNYTNNKVYINTK